MSVVRARILAELERRVSAFPHEIDRLSAAVAADDDGFGIHATQVGALGVLMSVLLQRQREILAGLGRDLSDGEFADQFVSLVFEEMHGAQRVWDVFSNAFAARHDPHLRPHLDIADLVAAECYRQCIGRARNFGVIDEGGLREPPLVCPQSFAEPFALGRHALIGALGSVCDAGWRFHDLGLPIPLVLLPPDQLTCVWLLSVLCHEVGHDVDKDLKLAAELARRISGDASIAPERSPVWQRWIVEILADALGVLLGGAGFALATTSLLVTLAPAQRYRALDTGTHPHPLVRIPVLAAMLRRIGVPPLAEAAERLAADARALAAPDAIGPFLGDVDRIAATVLEGKLDALRGHAIVELNPDVASDAKRVDRLAGFLSSGELRPSPDSPSPFPYRLVPAAAQLAIAGTSPDGASLDAVQQRAAAFAAAIPRPSFLGGTRLSPSRAAVVARMAQQIVFQEGG